jgi:hypothetical protein
LQLGAGEVQDVSASGSEIAGVRVQTTDNAMLGAVGLQLTGPLTGIPRAQEMVSSPVGDDMSEGRRGCQESGTNARRRHPGLTGGRDRPARIHTLHEGWGTAGVGLVLVSLPAALSR